MLPNGLKHMKIKTTFFSRLHHVAPQSVHVAQGHGTPQAATAATAAAAAATLSELSPHHHHGASADFRERPPAAAGPLGRHRQQLVDPAGLPGAPAPAPAAPPAVGRRDRRRSTEGRRDSVLS